MVFQKIILLLILLFFVFIQDYPSTMPMLQKFGKIINESSLQNEEGKHVMYQRYQVQNDGIPKAGDEIVYDCSPRG